MENDQHRRDAEPVKGDALVVIDLQNDFLPGGSLPVRGGDEIVSIINGYTGHFHEKGLPIYFTRDWHPEDHSSFSDHGGTWPRHCVASSWGAQFHNDLLVPEDAVIISKATSPESDLSPLK